VLTKKQWSRIHVLYEKQASAIANDDSASPISLEQVAEQKRDAGRLNEALEETVLHYGMRRLLKAVDIDKNTTAARTLEAAADSRKYSVKASSSTPRTASEQQLSPPETVTSLTTTSYPDTTTWAQLTDAAAVPTYPAPAVQGRAQVVPSTALDDIGFDQELWSWDLESLGSGIMSFGNITGEGLGF